MLLTEYNEAKAMEFFKEDGKTEGISMITDLISRLSDLGRIDDVLRIGKDPVYRDQLLAEFKLN